MIRMKVNTVTFLLLTCLFFKTYAQDPAFSQYFMVPETLNPGFSGFENALYGGITYRRQWPKLGLNIDMFHAFMSRPVHKDSKHSFGVNGMTLIENKTKYFYRQLNVNYTYRIELKNNWFFRPAIEAGYAWRNLNFGNLVLGDPINTYLGALTGDTIDPSTSQVYFTRRYEDITAGFVIDKKGYKDRDPSFWGGVTVKHLSRPPISFLNNNVRLNLLYSIHAAYRFKYLNAHDILLALNYTGQGEFKRLDLGSTINLNGLFIGISAVSNLNKNNLNEQFLTSVNAFIGFELDRLRLGFSRDFNTASTDQTEALYELSATYSNHDIDCYHNKRRK